MSKSKTQRNAALVRRFLAGATLAELATRYGISQPCVCRIVARAGHKRTEEQRRARLSEMSRRMNADPVIKARKSAVMKAYYAQGRVGPKRPIFEHDPQKREEYLTLREAMGAAYARQAMGLAA